MFTNLIAVTVLAICLWAVVRTFTRVGQDSGHQFPTAYQLLKDSPRIQRREALALRFISVLLVLFLLLMFTTLLS